MRAVILSILVTLLGVPAIGQEENKSVRPIEVGRRVALLLGNVSYQQLPAIPPAEHDVTDMSGALRGMGFTVTTRLNLRLDDLEQELERFYSGVRPGDLAMVYYSGHGGSVGEESYILPVDFAPQASDSMARRRGYSLSEMRSRLESQGASVRLLVFDACRDASMVTAKTGGAGMVGLTGAEGTLVAFASAPRQVSRFATGERNSYYTSALVKNLREMGTRDLKGVLEQTQEEVYFRTGKQQRPWLDGFLVGKLYLAGRPAVSVPPVAGPVSPVLERRLNVDEELYAAVKESESVETLEDAAGQIKDEGLKRVLQMRVRAIRERESRARIAAPVSPPAAVVSGRPAVSGEGEGRSREWRDGIVQRWVPGGEYQMGCSPGDSECDPDEKPSREVRIERGFWMQESEVTQGAYERVTGTNPSKFKGAQLPVESVSWNEGKSYCEKVGLRLPSEEEWEYAARGGTPGSRYGELAGLAWYDGNSGGRTHEVKGKTPNRYGLYDMLGNVWEWTASDYDGKSKTLRGGSWVYNPRFTRASYRNRDEPGGRTYSVGFRCLGD